MESLKISRVKRNATRFLLLETDLTCVGGSAVLQEIVRSFSSTAEAGRPRVHLVSLRDYDFSLGGSERSITRSSVDAQGRVEGMQENATTMDLNFEAGSRCCLVLESLTAMATQQSLTKVLSFINNAIGLPEVACVIGYLFKDLIPATHVAGFEAIADCVVCMGPAQSGSISRSVSGHRVDGSLDFHWRAKEGRIDCEHFLYELQADGSAHLFASDKQDVATINPSGGQTVQSQSLGSVSESGMRIGLSDLEIKAKANIVLPHELRVQHSVFSKQQAAASDHVKYGSISYTRESDSERDSDEEVDDDIDLSF